MTAPLASTLNGLLNPFRDRPEAKIGLSLPRRLLRAFLISARNVTFFLVALSVAKMAMLQIPDYVGLVLLALFPLSLYLWIRRRERRGIETTPVFSLALFLTMVIVMADLRSLVDNPDFRVRFNYVISGDSFFFGGQVPTVWLQRQLFSSRSIGPLEVSLILVYLSYFMMPFVAAIALWHGRPGSLRLYLVAMFLANTIGTAYFGAIPTAPPWLASASGHIGDVTRIVPYFLDQILPGTYEQGYHAVGVNEVASFPSFHMAETIVPLFAIVLLRPKLRIPAAAYTLAMGFSLVYLGEHYVVDVAAGAALAFGSWAAAQRLTPIIFPAVHAEEPAAQHTRVQPLAAPALDIAGD